MPSKLVGFEEQKVTGGKYYLLKNSNLSLCHIYGQYLFQY